MIESCPEWPGILYIVKGCIEYQTWLTLPPLPPECWDLCHNIMMAVSVAPENVKLILQIVRRGGRDKIRSEQTIEGFMLHLDLR